MSVTRTLNPLPFRDLEPRRFEDLIRQLVYDFRPWLRLEATGRAGSDDGYDVRAIEPGEIGIEDADIDKTVVGEEIGEEADAACILSERTWLIQCKREREIGPTKLQKYLDSIAQEERASLHGIIFAACCDFSKSSRDILAKWCRDNSISEFQIWSVSDIETMLMQPKNDHILFAFFGLSLQIRKRSLASTIRGRLVVKRKIDRLLKDQLYAPLLLRDPDATNFPYVEKGGKLQWLIRDNRSYDFRGVGFQFKEYFAYINDKGEWDMANGYNRSIPHHDNPWLEFEDRYPSDLDRAELTKFYYEIEKSSQAILSVISFIPFEDIIAVDEIGDKVFGDDRGRPTLYVPMTDGKVIVHELVDVSLTRSDNTDADVDESKRIMFFPKKFRRDELG